MAISDFTTYVIYRIVCFATGKSYVGQTKEPQRRKHDHFKRLATNTHINKHLQSAYNAYGDNSFYFEILEKDIHPDLIANREQYWIAHFDCCRNGFNATPGGDFEPSKRGKRTGSIITWNGIEYPSIAEAARMNGIGFSAMRKRLRNGYVCDTDVPTRKDKGHPCIWNDVHYKTVRQAALACGVDENSMHQRLDKGYTCDEDMPGMGSPKISCVWNRIIYPSLKAAAIATGIPHASLCKYVKKGYTCDADVKHIAHNAKVIVWNGIEYPSITATAIACNVSRATMQQRINRGYTSDKDIHQDRRSKINHTSGLPSTH